MLNTTDRDFEPATTIHRFKLCCEPAPYCPVPRPHCDSECGCFKQLKNVIAQLIALFSLRTDVNVTVTTVTGTTFTGIPAAIYPSDYDGGLFTLKDAFGTVTAAISICKIASIYVPTSEGLSTIGYLSDPHCAGHSCQLDCENALRIYTASFLPGTSLQLITSYHSVSEGTLYANVYGLLVLTDANGFPSFVSTCSVEAVTVAVP